MRTLDLMQRFAAGLSTECNNSNDICVQNLPQTTGDGSFVQTALTVVIAIIAIVAMLFVVIGGARYILSQGDPQAAAKARSTIIYALVGLVVAILAQAAVIVAVGALT